MITILDFKPNDITVVFEEIESDIIDECYLSYRFDPSNFYLNEIKSKNKYQHD